MNEYTRNQIEEVEKIDLIRVINNMWRGFQRHWIFLVLLVFLSSGVMGIRVYRNYSPVYSANATFTITVDDSAFYAGNSYLNSKTTTQIVNTFPYILNSGILQKKIANDLGTEQVPGTISTEPLGTTNMMTIVVTSPDPEYAYQILELVIKYYPEVAEPVIGQVSMNLLDMTDIPETASNPPLYLRSLLKGAILGVALCMALLLVYAFTRNTIHEEDDFKRMLNVDCVCTIPQVVFKKRGKEFSKEISIHNKKISQSFLEAIRVLRARIEKDAKKNDLKVFLVTSAAPGEGKSVISTNIAMALAMRESKVVLVDCDLRNPSIRKKLNITEEGPGLYEYLVKKAELKDVLQWNEEYQMYIVRGGESIGNGSELMDTPRMYELLEALKEFADYIILDTAPVGILTDTAVLAQAADAALFVVKQDYENCSSILDAIEQLAESKIYISGCILNGAQAGIAGYGYGNYRYYSKYGSYLEESHFSENAKDSLQD